MSPLRRAGAASAHMQEPRYRVTDHDDELSGPILAALAGTECPTAEPITATLEEQKQYLVKWADALSDADRRLIGRVVLWPTQHAAVKLCKEGVIMNLDSLDPSLVARMYRIARFKREGKI